MKNNNNEAALTFLREVIIGRKERTISLIAIAVVNLLTFGFIPTCFMVGIMIAAVYWIGENSTILEELDWTDPNTQGTATAIMIIILAVIVMMKLGIFKLFYRVCIYFLIVGILVTVLYLGVKFLNRDDDNDTSHRR